MAKGGSSVLVSVCMITYNHEKYISQAIDGVLIQETEFPIELLIGEDCSIDQTRKICKEYQEKYPDIIKLLLSENNLGMIQNFIATLKACSGKYIALCEGDDYWTDEEKLQKQVDFLENNSEYIGCCHNVVMHDETTHNKTIMWPYSTDCDFSLDDLAGGNKISTLSLVFRNVLDIDGVFIDYPNSPLVDYILNLELAKRGKIRYLNSMMGVYRMHENGVWSLMSHDPNSACIKLYEFQSVLERLSQRYQSQKAMFQCQRFKIFEKIYNNARTIGHQFFIRESSVFFIKNYQFFSGCKMRLILASALRYIFASAHIRFKRILN